MAAMRRACIFIPGWSKPDGERGMVTMQDLDLLARRSSTYHPALLVFDPIQIFFGRHVDMNHANETRPVLDAVATLCKPYACTPLYVRHIGKADRESALCRPGEYRHCGQHALGALSRQGS